MCSRRLYLAASVGLVLCVAIGFTALIAEPAKDSKEITNSIGMKLILIPAGKFVMGSPETEEERENEEQQHEVSITKSFYMGVYMVTQGEYQTIMGKTP